MTVNKDMYFVVVPPPDNDPVIILQSEQDTSGQNKLGFDFTGLASTLQQA